MVIEIQRIPRETMKRGCLEAWLTFEADSKESLYILLSDAIRQTLGWWAMRLTLTQFWHFVAVVLRVLSNRSIPVLCSLFWTSPCKALSFQTVEGLCGKADIFKTCQEDFSTFLTIINNISLLMTGDGGSDKDLYADLQLAYEPLHSPSLPPGWLL